MALISLDYARADRAPAVCAVQLAGGPVAKDGYYFQAMRVDEDGKPYLEAGLPPPKANNAPPGACTNRDRFGFTAFPDRYGYDGCLVGIVKQGEPIWQKDPGAPSVVLDWRAANPYAAGSGWSQN